jgi:hypothetical protein
MPWRSKHPLLTGYTRVSPISSAKISGQNQCPEKANGTIHSQVCLVSKLKILSVQIRYMELSTVKIRQAQTPRITRGRIGCLGEVSILYWLVTPAVHP